MGLKKKKISELKLSQILKGLFTIGYTQHEDGSTESVQIGLEFVGDAADSAIDAANNANQAGETAIQAATQAATATIAANQAADGANAAKVAADIAAGLANDAAAEALAATEETNQATVEANAATVRANTAADSVNTAIDQAATATIAANEAADGANAAKVAADTAAGLANDAAALAATATQNADSATESANNAATNANTAADNANAAAGTITDKLSVDGDGSEVTVIFTEAEERVNVVSGEKLSVLFSKIRKWFSSLKTVAFSGKAADLSDDETHRFTTDAEKAAWNDKYGKADTYNRTEVDDRDYIALQTAREYAAQKIAEVVNSAPGTLDTLQELAAALGNDPNFATSIMALIGGKADLVHQHAIGQVTNLQSILDGKLGNSGQQTINGPTTINGVLMVNPNTGSYSEGVRIASFNGWSNVNFGTDPAQVSGIATEGQWIVGKNPEHAFMICRAGEESLTTIPTIGLGISTDGAHLVFNNREVCRQGLMLVAALGAGGDDTNYGAVSATRPNDGLVSNYYSLIREGVVAKGIGLDDSNRLVFGSPRTGGGYYDYDSVLMNSDIAAWAKAANRPNYNLGDLSGWDLGTMAVGGIVRLPLLYSRIPEGYISRVAIGAKRSNAQWGSGLFSVGNNDGGDSYVDFEFNVDGRISSPAGTFALTSEIPTINIVDKAFIISSLNQEGEVTMTQHWVFAGGVANTSDIRFKRNIEPVSRFLDRIADLAVFRYNWEDEAGDLGKRRIGISAQEMEERFPEVVDVMDDERKTKTVDLQSQIAILFQAVKELTAELEEVKRENRMFKNKLGLI